MQKKDREGRVIAEHYQREDIEQEILDYNTLHFTKVHQSRAYDEKICNNLFRNNVCEKILIGNMSPQDFDDRNTRDFFKLLQIIQSSTLNF